MNEAAEIALASFQHEHALSIAHAKRADGYLSQFLALVSHKTGDRSTPTGMSIRCVREWTRWLAANGPELKPIIAEETGIKFSERGTPHTFLWDESMEDDPDDALPPNAIVRMQAPAREGRGRPPMIYFLWSQRFDVHPRFGVGPIKSEPTDETDLTGLTHAEAMEATYGPSEADEIVSIEPEPLTDRFPTLDEWNDAWTPTLQTLASSGAKPPDEMKQRMLDTVPVGEDPPSTLALAFSRAVQQGGPLLGVVQPEEN